MNRLFIRSPTYFSSSTFSVIPHAPTTHSCSPHGYNRPHKGAYKRSGDVFLPTIRVEIPGKLSGGPGEPLNSEHICAIEHMECYL